MVFWRIYLGELVNDLPPPTPPYKGGEISAAPYRDRVVHHAIHNIMEPIFDPTFIYDSYATRKGKGTHSAIDRFQYFAQKTKYVLKCDVRQYFPSIDRKILRELIERKIACRDTMWLIEKILDFSQNCDIGAKVASIHPSIHPERGIPIGNLTSQFFANIYLNGLDHFIKEKLSCRHYIRYMDDFVIFHDDKNFLWFVKREIQKYLETLRLSLHENKCRIFGTENGVPFLGLVIAKDWRRLKRENIIRFKRRMRKFQILHRRGDMSWSHIHQSIQSWIGHARHADTNRLRNLILPEFVFRKGFIEGG